MLFAKRNESFSGWGVRRFPFYRLAYQISWVGVLVLVLSICAAFLFANGGTLNGLPAALIAKGPHPLSLTIIGFIGLGMLCHTPLQRSHLGLWAWGIAIALCLMRMVELFVTHDSDVISVPLSISLLPNGIAPPAPTPWASLIALLCLAICNLISRNLFDNALILLAVPFGISLSGLTGWSMGYLDAQAEVSPMTAVSIGLLGVAFICANAHKPVLRLLFMSTTAAKILRHVVVRTVWLVILIVLLMQLAGRADVGLLQSCLAIAAILLCFGSNIRIAFIHRFQKNERKSEMRGKVQRAQIDSLTGAFRRDGFDKIMQSERAPLPRGIVVIDLFEIPHIQREKGDEVALAMLQCTAEALRKELRAGDHLFRWSKHRFVILANGIERAEMTGLRRRIQGILRDAELSDGTRLEHSYGEAWLHPYDLNFRDAVTLAEKKISEINQTHISEGGLKVWQSLLLEDQNFRPQRSDGSPQ